MKIATPENKHWKPSKIHATKQTRLIGMKLRHQTRNNVTKPNSTIFLRVHAFLDKLRKSWLVSANFHREPSRLIGRTKAHESEIAHEKWPQSDSSTTSKSQSQKRNNREKPTHEYHTLIDSLNIKRWKSLGLSAVRNHFCSRNMW